jgi:phosphoribosyl 1,2-cyclic phosphate phosphodiesterase
VPVIGCNCEVCKSSSSYNKRTRSTIFIDDGEAKILVDFGFEIREQLLKAQVVNLDAAILTHDHADHVSGIDNLRVFPFTNKQPLNIYTDLKTAEIIKNRYDYLFDSGKCLVAEPVDFYSKIKIKDLEIQFFRQHHSLIDSLGIRIGNFVYSSDVGSFPDESKKYLENIEVWILDCQGYKSSQFHAGLDKVLQWNDEFKPKQILLTNMRHEIDYHKIVDNLPKNIVPLYDGYEFKL